MLPTLLFLCTVELFWCTYNSHIPCEHWSHETRMACTLQQNNQGLLNNIVLGMPYKAVQGQPVTEPNHWHSLVYYFYCLLDNCWVVIFESEFIRLKYSNNWVLSTNELLLIWLLSLNICQTNDYNSWSNNQNFNIKTNAFLQNHTLTILLLLQKSKLFKIVYFTLVLSVEIVKHMTD